LLDGLARHERGGPVSVSHGGDTPGWWWSHACLLPRSPPMGVEVRRWHPGCRLAGPQEMKRCPSVVLVPARAHRPRSTTLLGVIVTLREVDRRLRRWRPCGDGPATRHACCGSRSE